MSKDKNTRLISALHKVAEMVGTSKEVNGNDIGLGMQLQYNRCMEEARIVTDGLFRVVVMGTFTSGKSTLINALLGSRILPESALPSTAILTFIQFGYDTDDVEIHYRDIVNEDGNVTKGAVEHISKENFMQTYHYDIADTEKLSQTGSIPRFKKVAYSIVRCSLPLVQYGVSIVDTPGLEDKDVATELALDIAAKAQAIIYVCGERGFAEADREYFEENFKGNPGNVFFILNKLDNITSDIQRKQALDRVRYDVKGCFVKADGSVDEALMSKRVFGLSSLLALDARRGMTFDEDLQKDVPLSEEKQTMKLQRSQFLPFEEALQEFLTTDERCLAQYGKVFRTLLCTYNDAVEKVREDLAVYEHEDNLTNEQKADCQRIINEIETGLSATEAAFDNCTLKLQNTLALLIRNAIDSVDSTWEMDLATLHEKIRFGMKDYLSLAVSNINVFKSKDERTEDMKRLLQPFSQIIAEHISDKIDRFMEANKTVLQNAIMEAEQNVNTNLANVSNLFSQLGDTLTEMPEMGKQEDQDWLQAVISYCVGDASAIVKNCAGGHTAWLEFIRKAVFNGVWQWMVIQIVTGGWGVIICGLIEWLQIKNGKNEMVDRMLTDSKNAALKEIHAKLDERLRNMNTSIAIKMNEVKNAKCGESRQRLNDEKGRLEEIERNMNDNQFNAEQERKRTTSILASMASEIKSCYLDVFGIPYAEELATI
uniref:dynamin family protein n=1 Tax=Segatella hominis TaxID=2518605 RepID=UPI0040291C6C